jgi:hypothetical protein
VEALAVIFRLHQRRVESDRARGGFDGYLQPLLDQCTVKAAISSEKWKWKIWLSSKGSARAE